jgi:ABC-type Fe3+ transport system permease subunit
MINTSRSPLWRRWQEFRLIGQDPVLALGLIGVGAFVFLFVVLPLALVIWQGFFDPTTGQVSFKYFTQFVDPYYMPHLWGMLRNTVVMGVGAATGRHDPGLYLCLCARALQPCPLVAPYTW